jgi:hypothetical protein
VATDWGPVVQTGVGASAAIAGGFIGAWVQGRNQERTERDRRRERAAEILAEARALLTEAHPDHLVFNATPEDPPRTFDEFGDRWQGIRVPLLTLSTIGESERARRLARQLEPAIANALSRAAFLVSDLLQGRDLLDAREIALRDHGQAIQLLDQLEEAVRRA